MTYAQFLLLFLCIPVIVLAVLDHRTVNRRMALSITGISILALIYTGPWDNLIIVNGVWSFGRSQVLGILLGHVPLEEYVFYVLQVTLTALVTLRLARRWGR